MPHRAYTITYGRIARYLAVLAGSLLVSFAFAASTSSPMPIASGVRTGNNVTVFHEIDMVAAYGYPVGEPMAVEVFRNGVKIGAARGPARSTADGGGLEVNHGPAGAPGPGDCWANITPDVRPGDRIRVTGEGGVDEVLVDDIAITSSPNEDATTADISDVVLEGRAAFADGSPIPVDRLSGELRQESPRFRAAPNAITRIPGTADGWRATYRFPYRVVQIKEPLTFEERKQAILNGAHSIGYGHTSPLPPETQIADFPAAGGPAPGCEGSPRQPNAVTTTDDASVNLASGDLTIGGSAVEGTTAVKGTLTSSGGGTLRFDATGSLSNNAGQKTWKVTIARDRLGETNHGLDQLEDGTLTTSTLYTVPDGPSGGATDVGGREASLAKDTKAPARPAATPKTGTYDRPQRVALEAEAGATVRYTINGTRPTTAGRTFVSPIPVTASRTIKAVAIDAVGNPSTVRAFAYVIRKSSIVSLDVSGRDLKPGNSRTISGRVRPAHPGKAVELTIKEGGRVVLVKKLKLSAASAYGFRYRPARAGRHTVSVKFAGDADHKPDVATRSFRVSR